MSLLTLIQDAMVIAGFDAPSSVYSNTDPTVTRFKTLSQIEGDILSRRFDWRALKVLGEMTGDGTSTEYTLPVDFDRFVTGYPLYKDESPELPLIKVTDDAMIAVKVSQTNPTRPYWRLFGDNIEFYPALENGDVVKIEYRTKYWIISDDATTRKLRWTADTDASVIPERVITLGCVWRYKQAIGMDYAEDFRTYQIESAKAGAVDNGRQTIRARAHFMSDYSTAVATDPRVIP